MNAMMKKLEAEVQEIDAMFAESPGTGTDETHEGNTAPATPELAVTPEVTPELATPDGNTATFGEDKSPEPTPEISALMQQLEEAKQDRIKTEQRHSVLQGKYDAEVPRLSKQVKDLDVEKQALLREKEDARPFDVQEAITKYNLPPEIADFDPELIKAMERMSKVNAPKPTPNETADGLRNLQKLHDIEERLFYKELRDVVPDWKDTFEKDKAFTEWVNKPDAISGLTPKYFLDVAASNLDVDKAAVIFSEYKSVSPAKAQIPKQSVSIAPAAAPIATVAPNQKTYTLDEWSKLSENLTKGRFGASDTPKARDVMNELDLALKEGRVKT